MNDVTGDLWTFGDADGDVSARVITTNGFRKKDGSAVLGRGCAREAREARDRWPWLASELGHAISRFGNRCFTWPVSNTANTFNMPDPDFDLVTMPVKPDVCPSGEPGFKTAAELPLIARSARQLVEMADKFGWWMIVLPRPGCGNGQLDYADVRPVIAPILDDRFHVITFA